MEDKNPYEKVIKKFLILLGLLFISPIFFSIALKAKRVYTEGIGMYISIFLIIIGGCLLLFAIYFGFRTFQLLLNTIFREEDK